jgi:hypothetical protein
MAVLLNAQQTVQGLQCPAGMAVFGLDRAAEALLAQGGGGVVLGADQAAFVLGGGLVRGTMYAPLLAGASVPGLSANGDLTSAVDQTLGELRIVVDPGTDTAAADALRTGAEVLTVLRGDAAESPEYADDITFLYGVWVSQAGVAVPADYVGGAYVVNRAEPDLAKWAAQMFRLSMPVAGVRAFSVHHGIGATALRASAAIGVRTLA